MTRPRKSGEERKAEIVETALELMAEQGTAHVTAQAIADRIGIAQPTVFRHFKSRNAIFRSALQFVAGQILGLLERGGAGDDPEQRLHRLLTRQLRIVSRNRGLPRLLFSDRLHLEDPRLKGIIRDVMGRYVRHVRDIIADGQRSGQFSTGTDARTSAVFVMASVQGLLLRWSLFDFEFALEHESENLWRFVRAALVADSIPENESKEML